MKVVPSREITFESSKVMLGLIIAIVLFFIGGNLLFDAIWKDRTSLLEINIPGWVVFILVLAAIVVHELIHGLIFAFYAVNGFKAITFGFSKTMGSPYCHCKDAVKVKYYRRAGIAPLVILGLMPLTFAMITGVNWIKTFGLLLTVGGFGDLIVWIKLFQFDSNLMVRDHPERMGFILE